MLRSVAEEGRGSGKRKNWCYITGERAIRVPFYTNQPRQNPLKGPTKSPILNSYIQNHLGVVKNSYIFVTIWCTTSSTIWRETPYVQLLVYCFLGDRICRLKTRRETD